MYNVSQKEAFIDYLLQKTKNSNTEAYKIQVENFFNRLEPMEENLQKEFSMCNFQEMKLVLSVLCRRSINYQKSTLSQLRQYMEWCINTGRSLDTENRMIGIVPKDIDFSLSYKMSMVKDENQLSEYLDIVLRPMADDTIDNMYRGAIHLVFNGLKFEEALSLKKNDVDLEKMMTHCDGKIIELSEICCEILKYLFNMKEYVSQANTGERIRNVRNTGHVLERTVGNRGTMANSMFPNISKIFNRLKDELGYQVSITLRDILTSGIFYRMYKKECDIGEIDFFEYIAKSENQIVTINNPKGVINDGMQEYTCWKKAFNLT